MIFKNDEQRGVVGERKGGETKQKKQTKKKNMCSVATENTGDGGGFAAALAAAISQRKSEGWMAGWMEGG